MQLLGGQHGNTDDKQQDSMIRVMELMNEREARQAAHQAEQDTRQERFMMVC
jgi:hypothetical protein